MVYQAASRSDPRAASSSASIAPRAAATSPAVSSASQRARCSAACVVGIAVVDRVECLQRHRIEVARLFVREAFHRPVGGAAARRDRLVRAPGRRALEPVVREVGKPLVGIARRRRGLEELGDRAVQTHALERHQLGEQHLPDERVREPETRECSRFLHDQPGLARFRDRVDEIDAAHLLDEREVERRAHDRGDRERVVRGVGEAREAPAGGVAHTFRQCAGLPRAARVRDVTEHLDEEERVPRCHLGELATERAVGVADRREVRLDVGGREAARA